MPSRSNHVCRIGCGSASDFDRLDWPLELAESGLVDYMGFDGLAERSIALAHVRRRQNPDAGHDVRLGQLVELFAPAIRRGVRMIGNWGAANPEAAATEVLASLAKHDLREIRVGMISGDNVLERVLALDLDLPEQGVSASQIADKIVAANVYIGADGITALLADGAQFVLGGRIADPSLFVGPICHELGWSLDDWDRVAIATVAGHLLECGPQVCGAVYADPPYQTLDRNAHWSFPFAEVTEAGEIIVSKVPGTGGVLNERTVKLQLGYEVHDPSAYLTPDVTVDLSQAEVTEIGVDRVRVTGISGLAAPDTLKVLVGLDLGWKVTNDLGFGGPGCVERARFADDLFRQRIAPVSADILELRTDLVGVNSLFDDSITRGYPAEVRLRVAARCATEEAARAVLYEAMYIPWNTAGVTGLSNPMLAPMIGVTPAYLPRGEVHMDWQVVSP